VEGGGRGGGKNDRKEEGAGSIPNFICRFPVRSSEEEKREKRRGLQGEKEKKPFRQLRSSIRGKRKKGRDVGKKKRSANPYLIALRRGREKGGAQEEEGGEDANFLSASCLLE